MADTFVQDPNERYEFLSNPSAEEKDAVWIGCTQDDYYLFGQVVPVRVRGPNAVPELAWSTMYENGLPIPLDNMEPVSLFDEDEATAAWLESTSEDLDLIVAIWKEAVKAVEAKLPERLKNSLFITK